ncbi:hypothetical protein GF406_23760 [candidate division KSB1 bacterium]|nr:hypothetical protein [candidate division KSB1 bacterium]
MVETLASVESLYTDLRADWNEAEKKILAVEEPALTVSYINWLIQENKLGMSFDFILNDLKKQESISTFIFTLNGETNYRDLYRFVWTLTNNTLLYKIEDLDVAFKNDDKNRLSFKLTVRGFFIDKKWELDKEINFASLRTKEQQDEFYDVFKATIPRPAKIVEKSPKEEKPKGPELIDLENATLKALANNMVYLQVKGKKMETLKIGDRVKNGRLQSIDRLHSEAIFVISSEETGTKEVVLGLGYRR